MPESFTALAHHVVMVDVLGDTSFLNFVADTLKVAVGSLNSSYQNQDINMTIRDRHKLVGLIEIPRGKASHARDNSWTRN